LHFATEEDYSVQGAKPQLVRLAIILSCHKKKKKRGGNQFEWMPLAA
jgi:hypothetical protein